MQNESHNSSTKELGMDSGLSHHVRSSDFWGCGGGGGEFIDLQKVGICRVAGSVNSLGCVVKNISINEDDEIQRVF